MSQEDPTSLPASVDSLRQLVLRLQQETASAREQKAAAQEKVAAAQEAAAAAQEKVAAARREAAVEKARVAELLSTVATQKVQLERNERTIRDLLAALKGKTRERIDPNQLLLFDRGELEQLIEERAAEEGEEPRRPRRKKRPHGRRLIPDHLPREEVLHELPEDQRRCPIDGKPMPVIRWETSEQLEYVPSQLKVIVHRRAVYACPRKHDESSLVTAPKPPQAIDKGLAGPGLLAAMVVGKFGDHLPGYRLEDILSRSGVEIRRSTIYDWLSAVADVTKPLYRLMKERVLSSKVIHTDDTKVKLIDQQIRGTRSARFWAYLGDTANPFVVYDFTDTRERAGPQRFLRDFSGYLQADAYSSYDGIYLASGGAIKEVACWTHTRRYWRRARDDDSERAHHVLGVIHCLYEIERACRDRDASFRQQQRQEHAVPLLRDLKEWLDAQEFLPKSLIGRAATYTRNQWDALNRYVEDGDLSIDNNAAERAMKPVAIGRKNWLFVGSLLAGHRAAVLMSLMGSCRCCHVEPWAWLRAVLTDLPRGASAESLLPDTWLRQHPQHRWTIAERRREERHRKNNL